MSTGIMKKAPSNLMALFYSLKKIYLPKRSATLLQFTTFQKAVK